MKNAIESICSKGEQMEDRISESEDRNFEMTLLEENKGKKNEKRKESRHNLWDSFQRTNIKIIWIPDVE